MKSVKVCFMKINLKINLLGGKNVSTKSVIDKNAVTFLLFLFYKEYTNSN